MMRHLLSWLVIILLLVGCSSAVETRMIRFQIDDDVNRNTPIAVDLIAVADPGLLEGLGRLSAREWFERRDRLLQDYPFHILVWSWEMVPGEEIHPFDVPSIARKTSGLLVFANYSTPGLHKSRIGPFSNVLIHATRDTIVVRIVN